MANWMEAIQHLIGSEFDEVLLHSSNIYRVLTRRLEGGVAGEDLEQMRAWLSFYQEQSFPGQAARFFSLPRKPPAAQCLEERSFMDGQSRLLVYPSGYKARNPAFQEVFDRYKENRSAYLLHWTHGDRGRKTIVCCHGWSLGDPDQAFRMFRIGKLYQLGLDVALFITPFHWKRASSPAQRFSPPFPFRHPVLGLEGFGQAIHDLAAAFLLLREQGAGPLGLIGASLGGYLAALFASLTKLADLVALVVPLVSFDNLRVPTTRLPRGRVGKGDLVSLQRLISESWRIHSPLSHRCKLRPEQCLIIASRGDRLCPFEDVQKLYEHWGRPEHTFLRGGHALFFPRDARGDAWYGFLKRRGFI